MILSTENQVSKFIVVINDINDRVESQRDRDHLYNSLISELETAASVQTFFFTRLGFVFEEKLLFPIIILHQPM